MKKQKIIVTGSTGLIGRNLITSLDERGDFEVYRPNRDQLNLIDAAAVSDYFKMVKPDLIIHLAAKVGGIHANNTMKYDFYWQNSVINNNVVQASIQSDIKFFIAMGTGCAYPKLLEGKKLTEEAFLDGRPEPTNDAYAYAKRDLLIQLEAAKEQYNLDYSYIIPANIYGPHDNFHPLNSHVVPGMIQRANKIKELAVPSFEVWGDGSPTRDFLFINDLIDAIILILENQKPGPINIASANPTSILDLAKQIINLYKLDVPIEFNKDYPNGQSERLFDNEKIRKLGWKPNYSLKSGLRMTIEWFENAKQIRQQ